MMNRERFRGMVGGMCIGFAFALLVWLSINWNSGAITQTQAQIPNSPRMPGRVPQHLIVSLTDANGKVCKMDFYRPIENSSATLDSTLRKAEGES